jgi:hypothetical protein
VTDGISGRLIADKTYYGQITVYTYGRVYWTPHDSNAEVEFSDETWPAITRIKQWLDERAAMQTRPKPLPSDPLLSAPIQKHSSNPRVTPAPDPDATDA